VKRQTDKPAALEARRSRRTMPRESAAMVKVGEDFYVLASSFASRRSTSVLANAQSFTIFDTGGDILESPLEALGFFRRDTRYLSHFELDIEGKLPYFLNSYVSDDKVELRVNLTNPDLGLAEDLVKPSAFSFFGMVLHFVIIFFVVHFLFLLHLQAAHHKSHTGSKHRAL